MHHPPPPPAACRSDLSTYPAAAQYLYRQHPQLSPFLGTLLTVLAEQAAGPASRHAPYLDSLPAEGAGSTVTWDEAELQMLAGAALLQRRCAHPSTPACTGSSRPARGSPPPPAPSPAGTGVPVPAEHPAAAGNQLRPPTTRKTPSLGME